MLDIGWSELAVIAVIALLIVGPKDLPRILRMAGRWAAKARSMAREFQGSIDDMVRESELDDVRKSIEKTAGVDLKKAIKDTVDPTGDLTKSMDSMKAIDPIKGLAGDSSAKPAQGEPAKPESTAAKASKPAKPATAKTTKAKKTTKTAARSKAKAKPTAKAKPAAKAKPRAKARAKPRARA